ncbi:MAG: hypothetical protein HZA36_00455 [Parcubacteria group bacterium]|nr:hypothetical protein [Parcubacteria group bacterium]
MEKSFLLHMLHLVKTKDGQDPFKNAAIRLIKLDPHITRVGQRFIYRDKYVAFMENVPGIFSNFLIPCGLGDLGAYMIFGLDKNDTPSLALYVPPLVERHGSHYVLMDGIHRNYIARQQGSTPNVIVIYDVSVPFPCEAKIWKATQVIPLADRHVEVKDRFFDLNDQLMRDLKYLGIDG